MHPSPQYFEKKCCRMRAKVRTELKKGVIMEFFSEIVVFLVTKGSYTTFNTVKIRKIRKTWSMTKKKVIRHSRRENGNIFRKKSNSEILVRENFFCAPKLGARSLPLA